MTWQIINIKNEILANKLCINIISLTFRKAGFGKKIEENGKKMVTVKNFWLEAGIHMI